MVKCVCDDVLMVDDDDDGVCGLCVCVFVMVCGDGVDDGVCVMLLGMLVCVKV